MGAGNPTQFPRSCWRNALGTQAVVTTMGRTERFYQHRRWGFRGRHKIISMDRRRPLAHGMWRLRLSSFTIWKWKCCELRFGNSPVQGLAFSTCKISDFGVRAFHRPMGCHLWPFQALLNTRLRTQCWITVHSPFPVDALGHEVNFDYFDKYY